MRNAPPTYARDVPGQVNIEKSTREYPERAEAQLSTDDTAAEPVAATPIELTVYFRILQDLRDRPESSITGVSMEAIAVDMARRIRASSHTIKVCLSRQRKDGHIVVLREGGKVTMILTEEGAQDLVAQVFSLEHADTSPAGTARATKAGKQSKVLRAPSTIKDRPQELHVEPHERHMAKLLEAHVSKKGLIVGSDLIKTVVLKLMPSFEPEEALDLCRHMASDEIISYRMKQGKMVGLALPIHVDEMNSRIDGT